MHSDSSARRTYLASRSASEYTTTDLMPSSRQARWMRSAISPRLAIRIFLNIPSLDDEQRLSALHRLPVLAQDLRHAAALVGLDLVHDLHGFDDADRFSLLALRSDLDERLGPGRGGSVEGAHHRRLDRGARRRRGFRRCGRR